MTPPVRNEGVLGLRAAVPLPRGGAVLMAAFPGLAIARDGALWIDPDAMEAAVACFARRRARLLVALVCPDEVPAGALDALGRQCAEREIRLVRLPIRDYRPPGRRWLAAVSRFASCLDATTSAGGSVALCCQYGAGRSGVVAGYLLKRQGMSSAEAIAQVRAGFHEAIESEAQREWLEAVPVAPPLMPARLSIDP